VSDYRDRAQDAFLELDHWIDANGWAGFDPFDIRGEDWYIRAFGGPSRAAYYIRAILYIIEAQLPQLALRRALGVQPAVNAKGMGLLASAWLARYAQTSQHEYLVKAEAALDWLRNNPSAFQGHGISWGYPFHWNSRVFFPRGTPSSVVTSVVGDAWLAHYELTRDESSLEMLRSISRFLMSDLNRPIDEPDRLSFSYTPLDDFKVLNASLFAAAFLARLGSMLHNEEMQSLATRAAAYVISEQNADGSFWYWGSEPPTFIDHFHTGFVLRHLDTIAVNTSCDFIAAPLKSGYAFYRERLFANGIPLHSPGEVYPLDIPNCAEALICLSQLAPKFGGVELIDSTLEFATTRMRHSDGYYAAAITRSIFGERRIDVPYMRWGQAWMLYALASLS
jgi:hypothetical protein